MRSRSTANCSTSSDRDVDGRRRPAPIRTPEEVPQVGGCPRLARAGDLLRSAPGDDAATLLAAFGTEVDHAVRGRDDVQVVLDDDDGIAPVHEALQRGDELCDVRHVQPRRGLVEHEDGPPEGGRGELGGQLDPLCFATGERRARLPELEIHEPDLREEVERPPHRRVYHEELEYFVDRTGDYVG